MSLSHFIANNILVLIAVFMFFLGLLVAYFIFNTPLQNALKKVTQLELEKLTLDKLHEERLQMLDESHDQLYNAFASLSQQALKTNSDQFLQLAQETLARFHSSAQIDLEYRKEAVDNLIKPIQEALEKTTQQVHKIEQERRKSFSTLTEQLKTIANDQASLRQETRKLVTALRRPEVRGQWGEISLKRIAELAGMVEYCDFIEQVHQNGKDRTIRPDMVVNMPNKRQLIIDAKTPMDAYLDAASTEDETEQKLQLIRHAKIVRNHMRALASKRYWEQFTKAPDFVILFIPGDQFLSAALEYDKSLLADSLAERVILSTPSSLVALLRAVAFGWKQESLAENAEKIRELGEELYKRVAIYSEHMGRLGKSLSSSVEYYNKAIGSLERSVLPSARRFTELGLQAKKTIVKTDMIENVPRIPVTSSKDVKENTKSI